MDSKERAGQAAVSGMGRPSSDRSRWKKTLSSLSLFSLPLAAVAHGDVSHLPQAQSVPGPPEWATLEIIGSNTLQTTFAPPLWDGGSPVSSYLVEWDKEAGIPEVQRIVTSQDLNSNEIQSITTSVPDVNEIQVVRTSASAQAEVQSITVSPPPGDATVDSAYAFALSIDTISVGGSLQYSGQISANADPDGTRSSVAHVLENMANVHERPTVERSEINADGGHTYLVTFPTSMGNVPEMEVFMTDLPVSITTLQEGNELEGSFRLEFMGELTADIPFDASSSEMQRSLEGLDNVGAVSVSRSLADEQSGFTWEIEFLSDSNGGNLPSMTVHGDGLRTSNPVGGAEVEISTGRDGSYIAGSYTLSFRGEETNPIPHDADASAVKEELEALSSIARVHVERTPLDNVGGCTWTISFLEDGLRLHRGDMPLIVVDSSLIGTPGETPSIIVTEERKGTEKEVQTIAIDGGGADVDPTSSFRLRFGGEETGDILALPLGGNTCLGSTKARQIITTSTVDTSGVGGDDSVSHLTNFALIYEGYHTSNIMANGASCEDTSEVIAHELMKLPPLYEVSVAGSGTGAGDEGCSWEVTFLSVMGSPELMTVTATNGDVSAGPGHSVTVGDAHSIIRDTIAVSQPSGFEGDVNLIQSELSKLSTIGIVTVTPASAVPDSFGQCSWRVTFEDKAGDVAPLEASRSGTGDFSTNAELNSGNRIVITDDTVLGTSEPVSGDFRLEFDGQLTGYLPHDASAELLKSSLDALGNIGDVSVSRFGPDVNGCYTWEVTFISDLGPLPLLVVDDLDLTGTVPSMAVSKATEGILPPFDGPDYGSRVVTDSSDLSVSDLSVLIPDLKQGIPYYVRISASNAMGTSPSIMPYPPVHIPFPHPPAPPSEVSLEPKDGSTLAVTIDAPFHDGGMDVTSYRVDYSEQSFVQERQKISLTCSPEPEIQSVTTSATDINEIQYLVLDSSYSGNGEVLEVQRVRCDATGGTFGLLFNGETAYISHDADENDIKESLESLSVIDEVAISFNHGTATACLPFDGSSAGDFMVTFRSLSGMAGDLPLMIAETSGLDGARHVEVNTEVDGDALLSGSLKLSFRGAISEAIDISLEPNLLADAIDSALEALDTIQQDGVVVSPVTLDHGGYEKIFSIEFRGSGVGGNVEALVVVPEHLLVLGSSADAFVLSDGESYAARNGLESVTSLVGNELSGHFRLRLRGHTTGRIPFNSSVDKMKAQLENLPNIGEVDVQMSGPSKELAYTWTITFLSNPGYFPPSARNVDDLEAVNELSTSVESDDSASILVETVREGNDRLKGQFQLTYHDGQTSETTQPLENFVSAEDMKLKLEALPNVGEVTVVRSKSSVGYEWDVEFTSCALKNGVEVCNDGDLLPLSVSNVNLQGCGGPSLSVSELVSGSGADPCPHLSGGICSDEEPFGGEYPIRHDIRGLTLGTPYHVQVRLRNSQSYGYRLLSTPLLATPQHNPPGPPPPVRLVESSSTSITVGWDMPTVNGGKAVSGYELWMDTWSGGDTFMIYDGAGSPDVMEYRIKTNDVGPHSQVVETGRQYRFQLRAINNCDTEDLSRSCYGDFSEVQIFTVRDPRPPLPPSMPQRDSLTRVTSSSEATVSISWSPPSDNEGSPITGYVLYMRDSDGTMTNHALGPESTAWQSGALRPGEVYRFHVVATNAIGKSGNSPVLSTLAAMHPGLSYSGESEYSKLNYRPLITDVQENALSTKWSHLPADITGGSPITGFKVYLYKYEYPLLHSNSDPIKEEVQHIVISPQSQSTVSGTFTASFRGHETSDIAVDATADEVKAALENLDSINLVRVESISDGWGVTFLSEAGDLPLMQATSGRLSDDAKVVVAEVTKGDPATLVYDGSETPGRISFEALDLTPDSGYAFKVAPVNAIGDGILSSASIVTVARAGASASKTTASGSALSRGIAGSIQEEQAVTFLSDDCSSDSLILSFEFSDPTGNLCDATEDDFEAAVESLGVGNVHVSREATTSPSGHAGYSWSVTFISRMGDVPMLAVDRLSVGNGRDSSGERGLDGNYVVEFLKGQSNEFTIEPKKASGSVVRDISTYDGMEGGDAFFSELWTSDASVLDGSHTWYSDGDVSSYNPLLYIEQMIAIPEAVGTFHLSMDTSEERPLGRIDGMYSQTRDLSSPSEIILEEALSELPNVGKVEVSRTDEDDLSTTYYVVTFRDVFGEYPLLVASDPSIAISRNGGQFSATEIQTITMSADKPFVYEVQTLAVTSASQSFDLSYQSGPRTSAIPCDFSTVDEARGAVSSIEAELNALPDLKVRVDSVVSGTGEDADPWKFRVTFLEPVGPLPLLDSDLAAIEQVVQGESTLAGSVVLSYEGEYTHDIPFDASPKDIKDELELLDTVEEVNVRRIDKYTGYQWVVSFTGNAGNLPLVVAHDNVFEVQSIETSGGQPTPLGGTFTLSYLAEETGPLPFDSSAELVKSSLEALPSVDRVDVSRETFDHGQCRWLVTFRLPKKPALLNVDSSSMSGTLDEFAVSVAVASRSPSLVATSGSPPLIIVEEKVPGRPSYTGQYRAENAGNYSLAVLKLESGGLSAKYYDNQWLLEDPVIERVDPTINFHWGSDTITKYGRDYVSVRWWGKVRPQTTEPYTFYLHADDGVRLFIDHVLIIDLWEEHSIEKKATVALAAGSYHDIKVEYKEITGDAHVQLEWSSRSIRKQIIPSSQLFHPSHIVGSPFLTTVFPGAADYPHSNFVDMPGQSRSVTTAGDRTSFYLQAKDSSGNNKLTSGDSQGDVQSPEEQFTVDIVGEHGSTSGDVTYLEAGQYRVDYTVLKAGTYQVSVKTGGTDIYCGLGEENKCSPFTLAVLPGATLATNCEVESSFDPVDFLVEARAGDIGKVYLQAKDAFGNNRATGGDDVLAKFKDTANHDIQYRGNVQDREDGSYVITYSIPLAGSYLVSITVGGDPVKYCVGPSGDRWDSREYDGKYVYSSPPFCSLDDDLNLHVVHRELHGVSSTVVDEEGLSGLSDATVGVETGFVVQARDKFGNNRSGSSTTNIVESGDGRSDAFLVSLVGPSGHETITSTAVETLTSSDSSVAGYFRLSYGSKISDDIPHDISGPAMEVLLSSMHDGASSSVEVTRLDANGNYQWEITFVDRLELWSQNPLAVLPGTDGFSSVSDTMSVAKRPSAGIYPVRYTLWEKGLYELSIYSGSTLVSGSSYTVEVGNGAPQASSSSASGSGLQVGVAGEESSFEVRIRDRRQPEIQSIKTSATVIDFINEVQRIDVISSPGESFRMEFRGQQTSPIEVGSSTLTDVAEALESLPSIGRVAVSSDGSSVVQNGDKIDVEFLTEHGSLDLLIGPEVATKLVEGEAPYRAERHEFYCDADAGYIILSYNDGTATVEFNEDVSSFASKLSLLHGSSVSIVEPNSSTTTVCDSAGKVVFVDFPVEDGDVEPVSISYDALVHGSMSISTVVDGISPIMGHFSLVHDGATTAPIAVDATAQELKTALEDLPTVGAVSVTKDRFGIRQRSSGENMVPGSTSLFSVWSVTFADDGEVGCHPGSWDKCPANLGDVAPLSIDTSLVRFEIGATQQQPAPSIEVFEARKGSAGNMLDEVEGQADIEFSLSHNLVDGVGIGANEEHELKCVALEETGSFELEILNERVLVGVQTSLEELKLLIGDALGLTQPLSSAGSSHGTICHFDPSNPVTALTKLTFSKEDGPIPKFYVSSQQGVVVTATNLLDAIDKVDYIGGGLYRVNYTPTISGHYSASVRVNDDYVWTDLSPGVVVAPSEASAHHCTHDSSLVATAGKEEAYSVVARDRFGNRLSSTAPDDASLVISLSGMSDSCGGARRTEDLNATIEELEIGSPDRHYRVDYTPSLAGLHRSSIELRSRGGLLATYFKNPDFSQAVYGNNHHNSPPYHESPWCAPDEPSCDSTRLDEEISFDWGFESPFPMDSFSVAWEGEIRVNTTEEYTFTVRLNGGVRLTVGGQVVIDKLLDASAEYVSSNPVMMEDDVFHPIKVEYSHSNDEAHVELLWESLSTPMQVVPSSRLFYTRHISGSSPSPFFVQVAPGDIDVASSAQGDGLTACVSLEECSFVVQTKDANQNNRYNDGTDPGFDITITGNGGWAGEGRINSVVSSSPIVVSDVSVTNNDWQYVGDADVTHLSGGIRSKTSFVGTILRGDRIVVDGTMYTVSSSETFDATSVPLLSSYLGPTAQGVSVYKASKLCTSGTHAVRYTPSVRGSYLLDVKLPTVTEVQRVTTSARSHSSLSGAFTLTYLGQSEADPLVSGSIDFDADGEAFRIALESIETIGSVAVSLHDCIDPAVSCSWVVTFSSLEGDVNMLVPNKVQLGGDVAEVGVEELTKGRRPSSIAGFPRTISVSPGPTDPSWTTAFGQGLVTTTAGEVTAFTIQPKDSHGNDRLPSQDADLFAVRIYSEEGDEDGSYPVREGTIERRPDGFFSVDFVPETSGFHTIAVVQAVSIERQTITTGYNSKARGGTFAIKLGTLSTPPLAWDADEVTLKKALDSSMENVSTFRVEKETHGLFNFKYVVSFETLLGDVPAFTVDTADLIGNSNEWDVDSTMDGRFSHIKVDPAVEREIQSIKLEVLDPSSLVGASFTLSFKGQRTDPIPLDANDQEVLQKLEMLNTVGDILVTRSVDGATNARAWQVTFDPHEGKSPNSLANFGDLPLFEVSEVDTSISVVVESVQDGVSPFRVLVLPAEPSSEKTTARDHPGVRNFEGLSTGVYKSETNFFVQSRDEYSNEISEGPLGEVQIIETSASSQIGGYFEISMFDATVRVKASAFTTEVEKSLQSIPGVGSLEVSSNSAKDLVAGKTVSVVKGLATITPSEELTELVVGDWLRIGDQDREPLFSIVEMAEVAPFTVTLSSPYLGETDGSLNIFHHGSPQNRPGYQYIVTFDPALGDLPELGVDGTLLEGDGAGIEVTSCDWNVHQDLRLHATSASPIDGHFYLSYGDGQTRMLSVGTSGEDLENAILSDIPSIHSLSISHVQDNGLGEHSWSIRLMSFDGEALLFFAEGHLLSGGTIVASKTCPVASQGQSQYSAESIAGRRGEDFVVTLDGSSATHATVNHIEAGRYLATYVSPRVGEYSLSVQAANFGGLTGEYFNNRWLYSSPILTRVDQIVDFQWDQNDPVSPTGKDFISVRWTGYIKPAFNETYTFTAHVNDALRLWIGDELLIDEYENEVDDVDEHVVFAASTGTPLNANQLVAIKIEYKENRGSAMIRLFWESISQPFAIVDRHRLYYNASHIHGSPFEVTPQAIEPSRPTLCSLAIASWDSLQVDWSAPEDDGGNPVNRYLVESWDTTQYGVTEKQQLRIKGTITGGFFSLEIVASAADVPIGSSAMELEALLESLPNVGDVEVMKTTEAEFIVYDIEFLTNNRPVPVLGVDMLAATPESERNEYCVCAKGSLACDSGSPSLSCSVDASREGSVVTQSQEVVVENTLSDGGDRFSRIISGLEQSSSILDGFGVRVSAGNSVGYGVPCSPLFLKPRGPPLPPHLVELVRVASEPSSLALHFTSVTSPEDKGSVVSGYFVEWSTSDGFELGTTFNATLSADAVSSERLSSYKGVDKTFNYYLIEDLSPGVEYFARIAAMNEAGAGPSSRSTPLSLRPGSKPSDFGDQSGVTVSANLADGTVSVKESSSTLRVSWRAPSSDNGFGISQYLVEYWLSNGVSEVQEIALHSPNAMEAQGTFTLGYSGDITDSLSIDSSAEDVQSALESLNSIRSVRVWRSGSSSDYKWTVTFLSEFPAVAGKMLTLEDATKLSDAVGGVPTIQINVLTPGVLPIGYDTHVVDVGDPLRTHYDYTLTDLTPGQPYNVQVSAANHLGYGRPRASIPSELAPPVQKPSSPTNVILSVSSSQSLEVVFSKPESDGGDTVSLYRIEWDTDPAFDSLESSPLGSYSFIAPKTEQGCDPCLHQVTGLMKGQNYYVRVYAYNSHGYSVEPGLPTPEYLSPKTTPDPPGRVLISPHSDTEMLVTFPHSDDDGGAPVTKYKVEWNAMGYFAGMPSMNNDHTSLLYSPHNVQSITLSADEDDLGGAFRVAFGGHSTVEISAKSTANDMKLALEAIPTIGSVIVSREASSNGFTWAITFLTNRGNLSKFGPIDSLTVSTDPAALPQMFVTDSLGTSGSSLLGTGARLVVTSEVTAFKGFEQQTVTTQCSTPSGILGGHFALSLEGARTNDIPFDASESDLKLALEAISPPGAVQVAKRSTHDSVNAFQWTIIFVDRLGNVPLLDAHDHLTCSDGSGSPLIFVTETAQGVLPRMDGPYAGEVELNARDYANVDVVHTVGGLMRGMRYHFRVAAWNGAEESYGKTQYSTPSTMVPRDRPDAPSSVEMASVDDSTIRISWDAALVKGGSHHITKFKVELAESLDDDVGPQSADVAESFEVEIAAEVQVIVLESSADDMGGGFLVHFMGESSSIISTDAGVDDIKKALEGISTVDVVEVSIFSHTQDFIASYGQRWVITFTSQDGNLPSMLVDTGAGPPSTLATGGSLFGSSSVVRVETISDGGLPTRFVTPSTLSSNKTYTSSVMSFNGHSWSGQAASRRTISPSKSAPPPAREVFVNALSDTEVGVSWRQPLYSGGDPIASYRLEWDSDAMFDHSSATVSHVSGSEDYYYVVKHLDPLESYFVRVMAYSAQGFSEPSLAVPLLSNMQTVHITLTETTGSVDFSETFVVELSTVDGFQRSTNPISVYATSREVENELNLLGIIGAISVDREDRSTAFDSSGIETNFFDIRYAITLVGDDSLNLSVNSDSLGSITALVEAGD